MGNLSYSRNTCPSATLFITNTLWTGLGLNPGHRRNHAFVYFIRGLHNILRRILLPLSYRFAFFR
jgi:hypothetical protein